MTTTGIRHFSSSRFRRLAAALAAPVLAAALVFSPAAGWQTLEAEAFARTPATITIPDMPQMQSAYGVLVNASDGSIIAAKNSDQLMYPASMTKLMTVLVACTHLGADHLQDRVTITQDIVDYAKSTGCTTVGFQAGEQPTVQDLLFGTILPSGADAAIALGRYIAGSDAAFVTMMNQTAQALGLQHTHFENCIGLFGQTHVTTCEDMATIMLYAATNPMEQAVISSRSYTTSPTPQHPQGIALRNLFLNRIDTQGLPGVCYCAKTGYIKAAQYCAASFYVSPSGRFYICVTGHSTSSWQAVRDHVAFYSALAQ